MNKNCFVKNEKIPLVRIKTKKYVRKYLYALDVNFVASRSWF